MAFMMRILKRGLLQMAFRDSRSMSYASFYTNGLIAFPQGRCYFPLVGNNIFRN